MNNQMTHQPMAVVYTTIATLDDAKSLAHQAIEAKVAFCANIIPQGLSIYCWEGEVHEENECYIILKTSKERQGTLTAWLSDNHPYTVPVIIDAEVMVNSAYIQSMRHGVE